MEATKQPIEREWLSGYGDIEAYCGLSRWTILRAIQDGELRASKIGRKVLVRRIDLDGFLEARATASK